MGKSKKQSKTITNKKARFDYEISDTIVAGIVLTGAETKSLRMGQAILQGSFVMVKNNELWLINCQINPLQTNLNAMPEEDRTRTRKLLVTAKQLEDLSSKKRQGLNIIPIKFLTNGRHIKIEIGVGRGKKKYDKRQVIKKRDQERDARREN
jgi:SsrA-binding protein